MTSRLTMTARPMITGRPRTTARLEEPACAGCGWVRCRCGDPLGGDPLGGGEGNEDGACCGDRGSSGAPGSGSRPAARSVSDISCAGFSVVRFPDAYPVFLNRAIWSSPARFTRGLCRTGLTVL